MQRVRIEGLRDTSCPFDGCDQPYVDFIGWYLHCVAKHSEFLASNGGFVPVPLESEQRVRIPMFRCTTCSASVPIGQVQRHSARCAATLFPETLGPCKSRTRCKDTKSTSFSNASSRCGHRRRAGHSSIGVRSPRNQRTTAHGLPRRDRRLCS